MDGFKNLHLLLVDDDHACRQALVEFFYREGSKVSVASSGVEALQVILAERIDFSVMDVNMPGMTGPEVLLQLKKEIGEVRVPPTLLVSSDREAEALAQGLPGMHVGFIPKPIQLGVLRRSVTQMLMSSQWPPLPGLGNMPPGLPEK